MHKTIIYQNQGSIIVQSIILIVIGAILIAWSDFVLNFIVQIIGATIIGIGLVSIASHYSIRKRYPEVKKLAPFESYVSIVFGVILIIFPQFFISILMVMLGLTVLFGSLAQIYSLIQLRKAGSNYSLWLFLLPVLMLVLGLLVVSNPFEFARTILVEFFGAFMLIYGVTSLLRYYIASRVIKEM